MRPFHATLILSLAITFLAPALPAQNARTWVSGLGDDANAGTRTAPCLTLAGALDKTAAGGEIDVVDPGSFGPVTITKAITLDGGGGPLAGILANGTNGIVVNAGSGDTVVIRNFSINGVGSGLKGISFQAGGTLIIDHCQISGFNNRAVGIELSQGGSVIISDTDIVNNSGNGIVISPPLGSGSPVSRMSLSNCRVQGNRTRGLYASGGAQVCATDCLFDNNGPDGVDCESAAADVQMDNCDISHNQVGIRCAAGQVRISNCVVTDNTTMGILATNGQILSYGNNRINGNAAGNGPVSGTLLQQ